MFFFQLPLRIKHMPLISFSTNKTSWSYKTSLRICYSWTYQNWPIRYYSTETRRIDSNRTSGTTRGCWVPYNVCRKAQSGHTGSLPEPLTTVGYIHTPYAPDIVTPVSGLQGISDSTGNIVQHITSVEECCASNSYQGQGQVITSHIICGMWVLVSILDTCFWHNASEFLVTAFTKLDKQSHPLWIAGWCYLIITKLQRVHRWS